MSSLCNEDTFFSVRLSYLEIRYLTEYLGANMREERDVMARLVLFAAIVETGVHRDIQHFFSLQKIFQRLDRTDDKKRVQQIFSILPPYINLSRYIFTSM